MLKGIPSILSPELLYTLAAMGHGDDLVIGDCNFPADSLSRRCIRADGNSAVDILDAVLRLLPLDTFVSAPVTLMEVVPGTLEGKPPVWDHFREIVDRYQKGAAFEWVSREAFYERTRRSYAAVATTERAFYACVILKKGTLL